MQHYRDVNHLTKFVVAANRQVTDYHSQFSGLSVPALPRQTSLNGPPSRRSIPGPPNSLSPPISPNRLSLPVAPFNLSAPVPPNTISLPLLPIADRRASLRQASHCLIRPQARHSRPRQRRCHYHHQRLSSQTRCRQR